MVIVDLIPVATVYVPKQWACADWAAWRSNSRFDAFCIRDDGSYDVFLIDKPTVSGTG